MSEDRRSEPGASNNVSKEAVQKGYQPKPPEGVIQEGHQPSAAAEPVDLQNPPVYTPAVTPAPTTPSADGEPSQGAQDPGATTPDR